MNNPGGPAPGPLKLSATSASATAPKKPAATAGNAPADSGPRMPPRRCWRRRTTPYPASRIAPQAAAATDSRKWGKGNEE
jgi:hypothetical protein